ncbi:MAG: alpha-glucosidase, partial [Leptospiraceae bacterium]|nr:alpha-glucosidase [Leptospiraceae bacterium]
MSLNSTSLNWWQKTVIYQIYPRSFKDSNNDGVGDIPGIISKLDYLSDLGVETIWISPFYLSPGRDHGYDVSDYYSIDPMMGTLEDVDNLIKGIHKRGMKILFDITLNHTSDEHPWFVESKSSKDNPRRDWYIWKEGKKGLNPWKIDPPNNWVSMIGKSGWNYDLKTEEFYFSNFLPFQPDLNWYNKDVKAEMFSVLKYWFDKGVDGFRLDIFNSIYKDPSFEDNPFSLRYLPSPENNDEAFFQRKIHTLNHPNNFNLAEELRNIAKEYKNEKVYLGEVSGSDEILKSFLGDVKDGINDKLHLVFQFETIHYEFSASYFRNLFRKFEEVYPFPYVPTFVLGNHDQPRSIERVDGDFEKAKVLAFIQMFSRSVPVMYYGEEIGMRGADFSPSESTDPLTKGMELIAKKFLNLLGVFITRDDSRTPMAWNNSNNFGFNSLDSTPWLKFSKECDIRNVESQKKEPGSLLNTYRRLLKFRKDKPSI